MDPPVEGNFALGDDRDLLAQPFGMSDHVSGEDDRHSGAGFPADKVFESALVDRVETREGLVEDDQTRVVNDRAEQLHGLRHALGERADRLLRPFAEAMFFEELFGPAPAFVQGKATKGAHERYRVARMHCRVEAALFR